MALSCLAAQVRGAPPPLNSDAQAALDAALGRCTPVCFLLPGGVPDDDVGRERERERERETDARQRAARSSAKDRGAERGEKADLNLTVHDDREREHDLDTVLVG